MIAVADAGPLIALAKIDALSLLQRLYDQVWITPAVMDEAVTAGVRLGASDAATTVQAIQEGWLQVHAPSNLQLVIPGLLGVGEMSSIALALEYAVGWLLIDDADARQLAEANIGASGVATQVKGTLGIVVSAYRMGIVDVIQAEAFVQAFKGRPDIWISDALCDQVIALLRSGS
jgi:predicted nucleic acid-binding protein